jgi:carbon monoxide dehydrogenase subunit G
MGILIENEFDVSASPDDTYALMIDVERVGPCIPGAEIVGRREDGAYDARIAVKMGPLSMSYKGVAEIIEQDADARRAVLRAKGTEQKGQGTAQALMTMAVTPTEVGSHVKVSSDILVTGRIAQMGRGIMIDVAGRMVGEMAKALEATLERDQAHREAGSDGPPPAAVAAENPDAIGLVVKSITGKLFKRD